MSLRLIALLAATALPLTASSEADLHKAAQPAPAAETPPTAVQTPAADAHGQTTDPAAATAAPATVANPTVLPHAAPELPPAVAETHLRPGGEGMLHVQKSHMATPAEIASLLRIGTTKREQGDYASAEIALLQVLAENATPEQDREALLALARTYRKKGDFTKACAVYERFIKAHPADPELPVLYLELGRSLRALGAHKQAIARFYSVLNSTLKLPDQGEDVYRQLARTAQFEIAETYFQQGDYVQATRFFSRLKLLDLAPEDRARAHFKSAFALTLANEDEKAVASLKSFLDQNADDENVPEARYLLSISLRRLGRTQDSLAATLALLKTESGRTGANARRWAYWQRKTGNQLANEFYQQGEIVGALQIYQSLAALSSDASWNLPVTYQIGLCFERLRRFDRARECYQTIVDNLKQRGSDGTVRPELSDLAEMAAWRLSQIDWQRSTDTQLSAIFTHGGTTAPASTPPTAPRADSASASAHDTHGSAPIASNVVR